ncbi:MAG TPA: phosphodiester glycosidase family protein [Gammaproteobacteria bacterium]|nr:phosphodiester glycosidase family protein [Gammaproteobacteria bacterium]
MFGKNICYSMLLLLISVLCASASLALDATLPNGLSYESRKNEKHVIHILTIDPAQYHLKLVKAHNQVFGRETVPAIAVRSNAIAAINAGFFEIGNSEDGRPSGTLIVNGDIFSLAKNKRAFLQLNDRTLNLGNAELNIKFTINANVFSPDAINQFVKNKEIVFYNHVWGPTSLTPYDRQEIVVDKDFRVTNIVAHGDNAIPAQGWILSFPKSQVLPPLKIGQKMALDVNFNNDKNNIQWQGAENIVMGIPLLVKDGQVAPDLDSTYQKDFVMLPHARTAIGIQSNGTVVMVVVEHVYKQSLGKMSLEQARNILRDKQYSKEKLETMPVSEMCSTIQKELASQSNVIGLPLPDLAKLMVELKCVQAINLDGGGSSTLFLNGQVKNLAVGDTDEAMGQKKLRPVSNAIVVVKRD